MIKMTATERLIKVKEAIASGKKRVAISAMNIMLQGELGASYQKSKLKDEQHIIASEEFITAASGAHARLGLNTKNIPEAWLENLRQGKIRNTEDDNYDKYRLVYDKEVKRVTKDAGLGKEWELYVSRYLVDMAPPKQRNNLFFIPPTIRVEDINEDGELVIRIKPGLRYEDYTKAWKVFVKFLGAGARLSKPYTNTDSFLMYQDKQVGMSYKQIAQKYFPNSDPSLSLDRVKKAVIREKKRILGDK